ncbi:N-acetylmannosamine-6-phosphate 2-epimerase [Romboutsia sp.]|uniref:N-acetylmannosamine-6-phosphate 2-epimerase n=1 Tax=Romboutsia sp. TaxID=1965302 RepID=UPI003F3F646B
MSEILANIKNGLIVSCQALANEPLHSPFIMGRMALAAKEGGAVGIRANGVSDINEIKSVVDLPIIGIVKRDYENSDVYITPTMKEVDELASTNCEVIAIDATISKRPDNTSLENFVKNIRDKYPKLKVMADCSTIEEAIIADKIGVDFIAPTLVGYTKQSEGLKIAENDFCILRKIIESVNTPVIAEGNVDTPQKAKRVLELGAHSIVVGSIITRPQVITKRFVDEIKGE